MVQSSPWAVLTWGAGPILRWMVVAGPTQRHPSHLANGVGAAIRAHLIP